MVGKAGRPMLHARVFRQRSWIGFCVAHLYWQPWKDSAWWMGQLPIQRRVSLPLMSWQVSQEQSMFVGSKLLPVLIWASHSAGAGDSWDWNVPCEVPVLGFWSEWNLGFGLALHAPFSKCHPDEQKQKRCWLFSFSADHNFPRRQSGQTEKELIGRRETADVSGFGDDFKTTLRCQSKWWSRESFSGIWRKLRGIDSRVIWMRVKKEALDLVALQMEMFLFRKRIQIAKSNLV